MTMPWDAAFHNDTGFLKCTTDRQSTDSTPIKIKGDERDMAGFYGGNIPLAGIVVPTVDTSLETDSAYVDRRNNKLRALEAMGLDHIIHLVLPEGGRTLHAIVVTSTPPHLTGGATELVTELHSLASDPSEVAALNILFPTESTPWVREEWLCECANKGKIVPVDQFIIDF